MIKCNFQDSILYCLMRKKMTNFENILQEEPTPLLTQHTAFICTNPIPLNIVPYTMFVF